MSEETPLNPGLYNALLRAFGSVLISKHGQTYVSSPAIWNNRPSSTAAEWGETYRVCCPVCGDSGYHLYVSYVFGQKDPHSGRRLWLANCFKHDNAYKVLRDIIKNQTEIPIGKTVITVKETPVVSPGVCVSIAEKSPQTQPARDYLFSRGIDPDEAARLFDLTVCVEGDPGLYSGRCSGKIIIPVKREGKLRGWQARYVGSPPEDAGNPLDKLRYLSMPGSWRSPEFFGFDLAVSSDTVIVVEGPLDAVRQGGQAVPVIASMGVNLTGRQLGVLADRWGSDRTKTIILVGDGDAHRQTGDNLRKLAAVSRGKIYAPLLPDEELDPGSMDRESFAAFITSWVQSHPPVVGTRLV